MLLAQLIQIQLRKVYKMIPIEVWRCCKDGTIKWWRGCLWCGTIQIAWAHANTMYFNAEIYDSAVAESSLPTRRGFLPKQARNLERTWKSWKYLPKWNTVSRVTRSWAAKQELWNRKREVALCQPLAPRRLLLGSLHGQGGVGRVLRRARGWLQHWKRYYGEGLPRCSLVLDEREGHGWFGNSV